MLRTAIVGLGVMGRTHANAIQRIPEAEIACVVDVDPAKREKAVADFGCATYETLDAAIAAEKLDMVNVTVPTYLHPEMAIKAAQAGLHVLCEKPMALTPALCQSMIDASRAAGKEIMVAQVLRFWPEYMKLKEIIDAGTYGKMLSIHCTRLGGPPIWSWDNWYLDKSRSGGALLDLHVHDVDWINCLLGRPKAVASSGVYLEKFGGWAQVLTNYMYDGVSATAEGGWAIEGPFGFTMAFRALFEGGLVTYSSGDSPTMKLYLPGEKEFTPVDLAAKMDEQDSGGNISATDGYFNENEYFVQCIAAGKSTAMVPAEETLVDIEIANAEAESCATGKLVELP